MVISRDPGLGSSAPYTGAIFKARSSPTNTQDAEALLPKLLGVTGLASALLCYSGSKVHTLCSTIRITQMPCLNIRATTVVGPGTKVCYSKPDCSGFVRLASRRGTHPQILDVNLWSLCRSLLHWVPNSVT